MPKEQQFRAQVRKVTQMLCSNDSRIVEHGQLTSDRKKNDVHKRVLVMRMASNTAVIEISSKKARLIHPQSYALNEAVNRSACDKFSNRNTNRFTGGSSPQDIG